jgi:ribonuclease P protein component
MERALTFPKNERLTSKIIIDDLFTNGIAIKKYPYLLKYKIDKDEPIVKPKIAIVVPKRKAKLATDRNHLRRQIKEVYRLNKETLIQFCLANKINLVLFLIYTGKEKESFDIIEKKLKVILQELQAKLLCAV